MAAFLTACLVYKGELYKEVGAPLTVVILSAVEKKVPSGPCPGLGGGVSVQITSDIV